MNALPATPADDFLRRAHERPDPTQPARTPPPSPPARRPWAVAGIGLTIVAIGLFTLMDTIGKGLTTRYPVPQVVWARYFLSVRLDAAH